MSTFCQFHHIIYVLYRFYTIRKNNVLYVQYITQQDKNYKVCMNLMGWYQKGSIDGNAFRIKITETDGRI